MAVAVMSKIFFAVTFPPVGTHVPLDRLALLARRQLQDMEVIDAIDHLFRCARCFNNYRRIYRSPSASRAG